MSNNNSFESKATMCSEQYVVVETKDLTRLRIVRPYFHEFTTNFKHRWKGQTLLNVYETEFKTSQIRDDDSKSYFERAILLGLIRVNGQISEPTRLLKQGDRLERISHRHEPPVVYKSALELIVTETKDDIIVCNKPGSIPVHPSGAYRLNTLLFILQNERPDLGKLHTIHRLDRLTSGLILLSKSSQAAKRISDCLQGKHGMSAQKTYIAKVFGKFPKHPNEINGHPGVFDIAASSHAATNCCSCDDSVDFSGLIKKEKEEGAEEDDDANAKKQKIDKDHNHCCWIHVSFSVNVLDPIKGVHICCDSNEPGSKESHSRFQLIRYDETTDTSLVRCEPLTGRTHQLRLHLQLIGHPIANDPNYGISNSQVDNEEDDEDCNASCQVNLNPFELSEQNKEADNSQNNILIQEQFHQMVMNALSVQNDKDETRNSIKCSSDNHKSTAATKTTTTTATEGLDAQLAKHAMDLCVGCSRPIEPLRHREIWLHAYQFRTFNARNELLAEYKVPLPEWAM